MANIVCKKWCLFQVEIKNASLKLVVNLKKSSLKNQVPGAGFLTFKNHRQ